MSEPAHEPLLLSADAILPMDPSLPPILHDAGILISAGRIKALGELSDLRRQFGDLPANRERHRGVLLPGLINAHTHLELSYQQSANLAPPIAATPHANSPGGQFTQWVSSLIANYPPPEQLESVIRGAIQEGVKQSLRAGVTTIGDITRHPQITRDELYSLAQIPPTSLPRIVSFGEVVGLGKMRDRAAAMLDNATAPFPSSKIQTGSLECAARLSTGISPHAPYTVEGPVLRQCIRQAILKRAPLCMHLAELADETDFLRDLSGPLGREWDLMLKMDIIDDAIPRYDGFGGRGGPIRWAQYWGLLVKKARDFPTLLAHVNYCDNAELAQLATSACSVVYCPRTHAYFCHPPHRYRDMLESEVNVCLGTDSLASNPDLNILKEAQLLHQRDGFQAYLALDLITRRAATALGLLDQVGTLAPGKCADIAAFPFADSLSPNATADELAQALLQSAPTPSNLYINGALAVM